MSEETVAAETRSVDLYNMNDTKSGRMPGGPYLDIEENVQAEVNRANLEDREPDLDEAHLLPSAGTQLRPWGALPEQHANHGNVTTPYLPETVDPVTTVEVEVEDGSASPAVSGAAESDSDEEDEDEEASFS